MEPTTMKPQTVIKYQRTSSFLGNLVLAISICFKCW